jgi:zinc transporter, ZIP family
VALAIGIGLQTFPEGTAVAMPLRREGLSRSKSFYNGRLSPVVEPVARIIGAAAVVLAKPILPYALAFAAGAMIFVVAEELVPEEKRGSPDIAALALMVGFAVMMTLDVALG